MAVVSKFPVPPKQRLHIIHTNILPNCQYSVRVSFATKWGTGENNCIHMYRVSKLSFTLQNVNEVILKIGI